MQYTNTSVLLSLLAATGALALPYTSSHDADTSITVSLSDGNKLNTDLKFAGHLHETVVPTAAGPFTQVNLKVGKGVNPQDLRCQVVDTNGTAIVVLRDPNIDISFSDADKGAWTFRAPTKVANVTCDPLLEKISPDDDRLNLRVVLSNIQSETTSQTPLKAGIYQETTPVGSGGPFKTVELKLGALVANQTQRCQVLDSAGKPVTVKRNGKTDITFSDAGKGEWNFDAATQISEIICDPAFVAASA